MRRAGSKRVRIAGAPAKALRSLCLRSFLGAPVDFDADAAPVLHPPLVTPAEARAAAMTLRGRAVSWARSVGLDVSAAEDVAHEALETLIRKAEVVEREAVVAWLRSTVFYKVREHRRGGRELLVDAPETAAHGDPEDTLQSAELSAAVRAAMDRIADSRRAILHEVLAEGRSPTQVAAEQGVPESTLRARLQGAAEALRGDLHRQRVAEQRRTGGHSSWSMVALAGWQRVERRLRAMTVRRLVAALAAITVGGVPLTSEDVETLGPTPEELPVVAVAVEPLVQPAAAQAERGRDEPVSPAYRLPARGRHDASARFRAERWGRP